MPPSRAPDLGHSDEATGDTVRQTCDRMSEQDISAEEDRRVVTCTSPYHAPERATRTREATALHGRTRRRPVCVRSCL